MTITIEGKEMRISLMERIALWMTNHGMGDTWFRHILSPNQINAIGLCHYYGICTTQNRSKGFQWYLVAANKGLSKAMDNVGLCYYLGRGTDKNIEKAKVYFEKAAEKEVADAQFTLAVIAEDEGDDRKSLKLLMAAAEQNHPQALNRLGDVYTQGLLGVETDKERAFEYYERAAEAGFWLAMIHLAQLYSDKKEVEKSKYWFGRATAQNPKEVEYLINNLKVMTKAKLKSGDKYLSELLQNIGINQL